MLVADGSSGMEASYRKVATAIPTPISQKITLYPAEDRFFGAREPHTASWTTACAAWLRREGVLAD
ncbi:hypothetical protein [Streptosporangium roseum]|uniref:hypothetical protein n=1 Tax=Streptosporangium roseum TaxID=2001 RepID=UPI003327D352